MQVIAQSIQDSLSPLIFLLLLTASLAATWYGLFWSADHFAGLTDGLRFIDLQPWLQADQLFAQISTYSEAAVRYYLWWLLFDYAWPFVTYTTMVFLAAWLFQTLPAFWQPWFPRLTLIAFLTVLMDWGENLGFASLVVSLPAQPDWLAQVALWLHAAKLILNMIFNLGFLVVLGAAMLIAVKRLSARR